MSQKDTIETCLKIKPEWFEKIEEENKYEFTKQDMIDSFDAGINRGIWIASAVLKRPIDTKYPEFNEWLKQRNK